VSTIPRKVRQRPLHREADVAAVMAPPTGRPRLQAC